MFMYVNWDYARAALNDAKHNREATQPFVTQFAVLKAVAIFLANNQDRRSK